MEEHLIREKVNEKKSIRMRYIDLIFLTTISDKRISDYGKGE